MSAESVLREAVDDHRRELAALRARVKELEEAIEDIIVSNVQAPHSPAFRVVMDAHLERLRYVLHRPTPNQGIVPDGYECPSCHSVYHHSTVCVAGRPTPSQERP